jgi:hypothetical protein
MLKRKKRKAAHKTRKTKAHKTHRKAKKSTAKRKTHKRRRKAGHVAALLVQE